MTAGLHYRVVHPNGKRFLNLLWTLFTIWMTTSFTYGQDYFTGIHSLWDNRVDEWEIYYFNENNEESQFGDLRLKWPSRPTWDEWTFQFDDFYGEVKTKWKGDYDVWELRGNNKLISIRKRWRNDMNEWVITQGDKKLILTTDYYNNANDWLVKNTEIEWIMYTEYRNDPRDWIIDDYLQDVSFEQKLAILFIALFQSIPKG